MKQYLAVRGTQERVANLEVDKDTVYARSNIERIETEDFSGWQYDEIQYDKDAWHAKIGETSDNLTLDVNTVAEMVLVSFEDLGALTETLLYALEEVENLKNGGNA